MDSATPSHGSGYHRQSVESLAPAKAQQSPSLRIRQPSSGQRGCIGVTAPNAGGCCVPGRTGHTAPHTPCTSIERETHAHMPVVLLCPQQNGGHTHTTVALLLHPGAAQALAPCTFQLCMASLTANPEDQQNKLSPPSETSSRAFLRCIIGSAGGNNRTSPGATGPHCQ